MPRKDTRTTGEKVSDNITEFAGSWTFIFLFAAILTVWILVNTLRVFNPVTWDRPPFILLNLCLSFIAAFQAPFILMSQNRQAARDREKLDTILRLERKIDRHIDKTTSHTG